MDRDYAKIAAEILTAMYEHNAKVFQSIGDLQQGPEPLTADQVANDLRIIYNELTNYEN